MLPAAVIFFENPHGDACLSWLLGELPKHVRFNCSHTEWHGFTTVIPQILVETVPVALTIQVEDDPDPGEIQELLEDLGSRISAQLAARLRRCDCEFIILSATPTPLRVTDDAIIVVHQTDLDPASAYVDQVLLALAALVDGFIVDCVNGRVRCPGADAWILDRDRG